MPYNLQQPSPKKNPSSTFSLPIYSKESSQERCTLLKFCVTEKENALLSILLTLHKSLEIHFSCCFAAWAVFSRNILCSLVSAVAHLVQYLIGILVLVAKGQVTGMTSTKHFYLWFGYALWCDIDLLTR